MTRTLTLCLALLVCLMQATATNAQDEPAERPTVIVETTAGTMLIELRPDRAPLTVENFLSYVNDGAYDGTIFHRTVKNPRTGQPAVIQGGGYDESFTKRPTNDPIPAEWPNELTHLRGTIAMARIRGQPNSATNQFFINLTSNATYNRAQKDGVGYVVFGAITSGLDVADEIGAGTLEPRWIESENRRAADAPAEPVVITTMRLATAVDLAAIEAEAEARKEAQAQAERQRRIEAIQPGIDFIANELGVNTENAEISSSGLFYIDTVTGEGEQVNPDMEAVLSLDMWSLDGERFLSSEDALFARPFPAMPSRLPSAGWREGVSSMRPGGERYMVIPGDIGISAPNYGVDPFETIVVRLHILNEEEQERAEADYNEQLQQYNDGTRNLALITAERLGFEFDPEQATTTEDGVWFVTLEEAADTSLDPIQTDIETNQFPQPVPMRMTMWSATGFRGFSTEEQPNGYIEVPATFLPGGGSAQGLDGAIPGERRLLIVPHNLAFGQQAIPGIPPLSTLIIDIEILTPDVVYGNFITSHAEQLAELEGLFSARIESQADYREGIVEKIQTDRETAIALLDSLELDTDQLKEIQGGILKLVTEPGGAGLPPLLSEQVRVTYTGLLPDGTQFDSSVGRGDGTTTFPLGGVVVGWQIGLSTMTPGETAWFIIPPDLAYGASPRPGGAIQPDDTLVFEVKLVEVLNRPADPDAPKPPQPEVPETVGGSNTHTHEHNGHSHTHDHPHQGEHQHNDHDHDGHDHPDDTDSADE